MTIEEAIFEALAEGPLLASDLIKRVVHRLILEPDQSATLLDRNTRHTFWLLIREGEIKLTPDRELVIAAQGSR